MAKIYYQEDCNLSLLEGKTIAVIGYGSQGHAHALNAKESGCNVMKGVITVDKKFQIRLSATEDVKEFVRAAGQCDFDIDVFYNRVVIDAKSILGVLSLDLTQPLTVQYGGQNDNFEKTLRKFAAQICDGRKL